MKKKKGPNQDKKYKLEIFSGGQTIYTGVESIEMLCLIQLKWKSSMMIVTYIKLILKEKEIGSKI